MPETLDQILESTQAERLATDFVFTEGPLWHPDGMKVDSQGRVYCTGPEGCWVFDSSGNYLGIIKLPEIPANCAWGGPDHRTMFFTARTSVYTMRMTTPGAKVPRT